jgi:hypothetical protein
MHVNGTHSTPTTQLGSSKFILNLVDDPTRQLAFWVHSTQLTVRTVPGSKESPLYQLARRISPGRDFLELRCRLSLAACDMPVLKELPDCGWQIWNHVSGSGTTQALASAHDRNCYCLQRTAQKTIFILRSMRQPVKYDF